ncbi:hypothetical protein [Marinibacterium sp. SX1]|uniref:hypothetical protein n=1 Tax=Marinibacterium sp. SX1 TaxID=3388424 RepID=UPI003D1737BA
MGASKANGPGRRDVMALILAATGSALASGMAPGMARAAAAPGPVDHALVDHARALGVAVLRSGRVPREAGALRAGLAGRGITDGTPEAMIRAAVDRAAAADFQAGDTICIDGLMLSRTEAEALAYVAISHDNSFS